MQKKIIYSLLAIASAATIVIGSTTAFFSDRETSENNSFVAGELDLQVDAQCHYYHLTGYDTGDGAGPIYTDVGCPQGVGTWSQSNLGANYHFFDFSDVKPGDKGKNFLSLYVYSNDAWGLIKFTNIIEDEGSCNDAEKKFEPDCEVDDTQGELDENIDVMLWLDQGSTPGFQGQGVDLSEGDNIKQETEPVIWQGHIAANQYWRISDVLAQAYIDGACAQGPTSADGHNNNGVCHGLAQDGRMVPFTTYYFGLDWNLPTTVNNEIQADQLFVDLEFSVVQHRNNLLQDGLGIE